MKDNTNPAKPDGEITCAIAALGAKIDRLGNLIIGLERSLEKVTSNGDELPSVDRGNARCEFGDLLFQMEATVDDHINRINRLLGALQI